MTKAPNDFTINGLANECGLDRRTVSRLLAGVDPIRKGGREYYRVRQVVDAIRGGGVRAQEAERTRLYTLQADHEELRIAEKVGKLIPAEMVEEKWTEIVGAARAKLLALPTKIAQVALAARSLREIEEKVRIEVTAALENLSGNTKPARKKRARRVASASGVKGKRVGATRKVSQSGSKRRGGKVAK